MNKKNKLIIGISIVFVILIIIAYKYSNSNYIKLEIIKENIKIRNLSDMTEQILIENKEIESSDLEMILDLINNKKVKKNTTTSWTFAKAVPKFIIDLDKNIQVEIFNNYNSDKYYAYVYEERRQ